MRDQSQGVTPGKAQPKDALRVLIATILRCQEGEVVHVGELAGGGAQAMLADGRKMRFTERQLFDAAYHLDLQEQARLQAGRVGERLASPQRAEEERPAAARQRKGEKRLASPRREEGQG